jgi:hypothetical protein
MYSVRPRRPLSISSERQREYPHRGQASTALESDDTTEIVFQAEASQLHLVEVAASLGCAVRHIRTIRREDGSVSFFYQLHGEFSPSETRVRDIEDIYPPWGDHGLCNQDGACMLVGVVDSRCSVTSALNLVACSDSESDPERDDHQCQSPDRRWCPVFPQGIKRSRPGSRARCPPANTNTQTGRHRGWVHGLWCG